ncbi:MAG: AAA family ATPase [Candidatus Omnitrophota bacterium]
MKIISVASQKGGCGKTTFAVNIAGALSMSGKKTLLIDLDPQAHATFALGCIHESVERKNSYDIFRAYFDNLEISYDQIVIDDKREKYSLIPASMMLSAAEINLGGVSGAASILLRALSDPFFKNYEYVIIDSPPNFGFLTLNSMYAADIILVPIDSSYFSYNGINSVYRVAQLLERETGKNPFISFALSMHDQRSKFARQLEADTKLKVGPYLLNSKIRASVRLREAPKFGKTIFEHDPKSSAAKDFYDLTNEVVVSDNRKIGVSVKEFLFHAPEAGAVYVLGDFNSWQKTEVSRLAKLENGYWSAHFILDKGKYRYKFLIDDEWMRDPKNPKVKMNVFGTADSILIV